MIESFISLLLSPFAQLSFLQHILNSSDASWLPICPLNTLHIPSSLAFLTLATTNLPEFKWGFLEKKKKKKLLLSIAWSCVHILLFALQVGTSSVVYPAAMFAPQVSAKGVPVAEFNMETTPATSIFRYRDYQGGRWRLLSRFEHGHLKRFYILF